MFQQDAAINSAIAAKIKTKSYNVLKLDIAVFCPSIKKEIEYCCNYLQRRRNINLLFISLNKFAECVDNRRHIVENVIRRNPRTKIKSNENGGVLVSYENVNLNVLFGVGWKIQWNTDHSITDVIEIYHKDFDLPNAKEITDHLVMISHPNLPFKKKVEVWYNIFSSIEQNNSQNAKATITEIHSSDDECTISSSSCTAKHEDGFNNKPSTSSFYKNPYRLCSQNKKLGDYNPSGSDRKHSFINLVSMKPSSSAKYSLRQRPSSSFIENWPCRNRSRFLGEESSDEESCSIGMKSSDLITNVSCSCGLCKKGPNCTQLSSFFDNCDKDKLNSIISHHTKLNLTCKANTKCDIAGKNKNSESDIVIAEADSVILLSDEDDDISLIETSCSGKRNKCCGDNSKRKRLNLEISSVSSSSSPDLGSDTVVLLD